MRTSRTSSGYCVRSAAGPAAHPFLRTLPADASRFVEIKASAPGYASVTVRERRDHDIRVRLTLQPEPAPARPEAAEGSAAAVDVGRSAPVAPARRRARSMAASRRGPDSRGPDIQVKTRAE
jgi:hypothetical protein